MIFTLYNICFFIVGLMTLVFGAELLVRKAHFFAKRFRIRPFIVGILLLGMGTSAPEWAVSVLSAIQGLPNLALGNVLGSNIFNIFIVLSLIILNASHKARRELVSKDGFFLFSSSFILIFLFWNYFLSRWESLLLITIFVTYILLSIIMSRDKTDDPQKTQSFSSLENTKSYLLIIVGFVLLALGSHLTIKGAVGLGEQMGMSERIIGILMVSVGTSLPELFVSFIAIFKGHKTMAVGNIIGSNVFNTYAILGTAGLVHPIATDLQAVILDLPILLLSYVLLLFTVYVSLFKNQLKILSCLFLSGYMVYVTYLLSV